MYEARMTSLQGKLTKSKQRSATRKHSYVCTRVPVCALLSLRRSLCFYQVHGPVSTAKPRAGGLYERHQLATSYHRTAGGSVGGAWRVDADVLTRVHHSGIRLRLRLRLSPRQHVNVAEHHRDAVTVQGRPQQSSTQHECDDVQVRRAERIRQREHVAGKEQWVWSAGCVAVDDDAQEAQSRQEGQDTRCSVATSTPHDCQWRGAC
jgi:hypothetical protein